MDLPVFRSVTHTHTHTHTNRLKADKSIEAELQKRKNLVQAIQQLAEFHFESMVPLQIRNMSDRMLVIESLFRASPT